MRRIVTSPVTLALAFLAVHAWLGYLGLIHPTLPLGDVTLVYRTWVEQALAGHRVGIDGSWVYPIFAFVPMLAAMALGTALYAKGWLLLVTMTNAAVFAFLLTPRSPDSSSFRTLRIAAAWWWLLFLSLLGPVALGRIDSFTVALVIVGLLLAVRHPAVAGVLLATATWIKVWPAALIAGVFVVVRRRWNVVAGAAAASVVIGGGALLLGAGMNVLSFVTEQTSRGLQIEAPISTAWMWMAFAGVPGAQVYYNDSILTFQVTGPGAQLAGDVTTPLLAIGVAGVLALAAWVTHTGAGPRHTIPPLALTLVGVLILFNKVGSPQFILWLSAPIIIGLVWQGMRFALPAVIVTVMAGLTQIIYPFYYDELLVLHPDILAVLTARNVLTLVITVLGASMLWRGRRRTRVADDAVLRPGSAPRPQQRTMEA